MREEYGLNWNDSLFHHEYNFNLAIYELNGIVVFIFLMTIEIPVLSPRRIHSKNKLICWCEFSSVTSLKVSFPEVPDKLWTCFSCTQQTTYFIKGVFMFHSHHPHRLKLSVSLATNGCKIKGGTKWRNSMKRAWNPLSYWSQNLSYSF